MLGDYFQVRRLLWDDIHVDIRPSEADELRHAIGSQLIDDNENLRQELSVLVDILSEFQQQNDDIRDAMMKRNEHTLEPPGRALLVEKLKLLAHDLDVDRGALPSPKEQELLKYVLSSHSGRGVDESIDFSSGGDAHQYTHQASGRITPRDDSNGSAVFLRPGTSSGVKRPGTAASSQRPESRGSTMSMSSVSAILESPTLRQHLNVDEIDSIKESVRNALEDEKLQLLEDIEFIQGCIDMEQDLLDDDRRKASAARPPPSLQELHDFRKTLEKSLTDQDELERVETIFSRTQIKTQGECSSAGPSIVGRRATKPLHPMTATVLPMTQVPRPPPRDTDHDKYEPLQACRTTTSVSRSSTKVLKIRHAIQEVRDEPFLT